MKYLKGILILAALCAAGVAISSPILAGARENARRSSCQSNLKNIGLGYQQYTADNDGRFPLIASNSKAALDKFRDEKGHLKSAAPAFGWADALQPYIKSTCIFRCPSEHGLPNEFSDFAQSGLTVYWMNSHLSGVRVKGLRTSNVILIGDGDGRDADTSARYSKSGPPTNTYNDIQPPWTQRHMGGANYSFADGHTKWLRPGDISTAPGVENTFSAQ